MLLPILIHTSVKLVTLLRLLPCLAYMYFNPHEREARDRLLILTLSMPKHFNPHEREARDARTFLINNVRPRF